MSAQLDIFDINQGRTRRDAGMSSVIDNAGEYWRERYRFLMADAFETFPLDYSFNSEWLRAAVRARGLGEPHHFNAWSAMAGSVLRAWMKEGRIVVTGQGNASRPQAHATKTVIYRKLK